MKPTMLKRYPMTRRFALGLSLLLGLSGMAPALAAGTVQVLVSTHPLARLAKSVTPAGPVQVETLLDRGVTPHDAVLRPRQLQQLVGADLVVWMGPEVEPYLAQWMKKRSGPTLDISTLDGVQRWPMREHSGHDHGHTHHARHDIHLWWSRNNLTLAGNAVAERLVAQQPDLKSTIEPVRTQFMQDMAQLGTAFAPGAATIPPFAVFHDGWQYLERDLGQDAAAGFVLDGELSLGVKHLAHLRERFKTHPVACVLLEPGMNTALVGKILPGTPTVTLDPLGWDAPGQGVVEMLRHAYVQLQTCGKQ